MMQSNAPFDSHVLDTLADDIEDLESILRMLNSEPGGFADTPAGALRTGVVAALSRLVRAGEVRVCAFSGADGTLVELPDRQLPGGNYDDFYYRMTGRGRVKHEHWIAATDAGGETGAPVVLDLRKMLHLDDLKAGIGQRVDLHFADGRRIRVRILAVELDDSAEIS
jgi:hypothetical protein